MRGSRRSSWPTVACVAVVAGACSGGTDRVTVLAASSLTEAFEAVEEAYEDEHPDVDVVISFGGSSSLAAQIEQGVPADVFAAADRITMDRVAGRAADPPVLVARNQLVIAVARGNPERVSGLADLARDDLVVVLAAPEVPAGNYAAEALAAAGVSVDPASLEQNVRAVAAKVALGEADAGIVYATDVAARRDRLDAIPIGGSPPVEYPIVALTDDGRSFVAFAAGPVGRDALAEAGFEVP